jgi:hypothetical protein
MATKWERPSFLQRQINQETYSKWLHRKAVAHVKRDRKRGNSKYATVSSYKAAIHDAVASSQGKDAYTGAQLDWKLLSCYDNASSKKQGRAYKKKFAKLPTVDHVGDGLGKPRFVIASWKTNDAKSDLPIEEFLALCRAVLKHHGYQVAKP